MSKDQEFEYGYQPTGRIATYSPYDLELFYLEGLERTLERTRDIDQGCELTRAIHLSRERLWRIDSIINDFKLPSGERRKAMERIAEYYNKAVLPDDHPGFG